jgi:hypothetical protein
MTVKRIGVLSCGKLMGILYGGLGLIIGGIFTLFALLGSAIGMASGEQEAILGVLFGVGAIIVMPIFYGAIGFISGLLTSALYNLAAGLVGGIELEVQ